MNDLERELRDLLEQKAVDAPLAPRVPSPLLKRARHRQLGTVLLSGLTVLALIGASFLGVRALTGNEPQIRIPRSGGLPLRTSTIQAFTVTSPQEWTLVDLWPLVYGIATQSGESTFTSVGSPLASPGDEPAPEPSPVPVPVPAGIPVFELANFDPGLAPFCGGSGRLPADDQALLYVAMDVDAAQGVAEMPTATWPVEPSGEPTDGPCGRGLYTRFLVGKTPYFAFAALSDAASVATRTQLFDSFNGMSAEPVELTAPSLGSPAYVMASGANEGHRWNLEVRPTDVNVDISFVKIDDPDTPTNGISDLAIPDPNDVEFGYGHAFSSGQRDFPSFIFGAASARTAVVEVRPPQGDPIRPPLLSLPESLGTDLQVFVAYVPGDPSVAYGASVAALDSDGNELQVREQTGVPGPAPTTANPTTEDRNAQASLRNALAAAKTYFTDANSYAGFDPEQALSIEPSLYFNTSSTAVAGEISIRDVTDGTILLVTATPAGSVWCIADDVNAGPGQQGRTTYGVADAQTVAECDQGYDSWGVSP